MAIKNASDLLVYAKTAAAVKQVTRIRILDDTPLVGFESLQTITISNVTNASGVITDNISDAITANTGTGVVGSIAAQLFSSYGYTYTDGSTAKTDGDYKYLDMTNGAVGIVPTLEITNGTATFEENGVIIEIVTPGSSAIFDPVAFSTSASFSTNVDLRDVTNKDSNGWSESLGGLKSFEVSTDVLQSINPDVPLDGTDFFDKLKNRSLVNLTFSDRIRNIIRTNLTQSGVDGFSTVNITQTNLQTDPFSGSTASQIAVSNDSVNYNRLQYTVNSTRLENKDVTWTFYAKGVGSNTSVSFYSEIEGGSSISPSKVEVLSGSYTTITSPATNSRAVNGLSTSSFTRIRVTYNNMSTSSGATIRFMTFPGDTPQTQTNGDAVVVSSWQIELSSEATDYQDPTDITHWQGNALVSSLNFDAGVEDNLTCSATFTGTGNIYPNGLGPELIGDTSFDLANDGSNPSSAYWSVNNSGAGATTVIENGYAKIITTSADTSIFRSGLMTAGDYYLLTYTVHTNTQGNIAVLDGWDSEDVLLPKTIGTHSVLIKPALSQLTMKRRSGATTIWLSSISLKKVL